MSWKNIWLAVIALVSSAATLHGQTLGAKTITVSGSEQAPSGSNWDAGTATLTVVTPVGTYNKTMSGGGGWGQYSTAASIASWLGAHISADINAPVWAKAVGATITLVPRVPDMPITVSGSTANADPTTFPSKSFNLGSSSPLTLSSNLVVRCTPNTIGPMQTTNCTASITGDDAELGAYAPVNQIGIRVDGGSWTYAPVGTNGDAMFAGMLSSASVSRHTVEAYYSHAGDSHYTTDMDATTYVDVKSSDPATMAVYTYRLYQPGGTTSGFDANGNITAYYESTSGQWQNIQYDSLNRIIRADGPPAFSSGYPYFCWTYDIYGNRIQQNVGTTAFTASSGTCSDGGTAVTDTQTYDDSNRLRAADHPSATFTPDDSGNLQNDDMHGYSYDAEGHLCAMSTNIAGTIKYRGYLYDASGIRIAQGMQTSASCDLSSNGFTMTNMYVRGADGETMTETDGSGNWQHTDVSAGGLVATYDNVGLHFQATDWLGSRKAQTNYAGVLEYGYQYMPFGEIAGGDDSGATEKLFTGQEHDHYSGLDYFKARYLGANTGRFMSPDPSGLFYANPTNPQSVNLYSYALNNPLLFIDPSGLDECIANTGQVIDVVPEQCANAGGAMTHQGQIEYSVVDGMGRFTVSESAPVIANSGGGGGSTTSSTSGKRITKMQAACAADVAINFALGFIPGYNAAKLIGQAAGVNFNFIQNELKGKNVITLGPSPIGALAAGGSAYSAVRTMLYKDAGGAQQFNKLNSLAGGSWKNARTAITELEGAASSAGTVANLLNVASAGYDLYQCKDAK